MARSWTDVANIALVEIGEELIESLSDGSDPIAVLCNKFLPFAREEFLCDSKWNFATKRATLDPLSTSPPTGTYAYYFQKPVDWIMGYPISDVEPYYTIEGDKLLSDTSPLYIKYIYNNTNVNNYSASAQKAIALSLASTIVDQIEKTDISKDALQKRAMYFLSKARRTDSIERPHTRIEARRWLDARHRTSSYARSFERER